MYASCAQGRDPGKNEEVPKGVWTSGLDTFTIGEGAYGPRSGGDMTSREGNERCISLQRSSLVCGVDPPLLGQESILLGWRPWRGSVTTIPSGGPAFRQIRNFRKSLSLHLLQPKLFHAPEWHVWGWQILLPRLLTLTFPQQRQSISQTGKLLQQLESVSILRKGHFRRTLSHFS